MFNVNASEIIIGMFFESQNNETDHLYASFDGINFYQITKPYDTGVRLRDPGLAYKSGVYYSVGGYVKTYEGSETPNKFQVKCAQ